VRQEVRAVDDRGRITLPAESAKRFGGQVLLVLGEPGRLRLLPWDPHGIAVALRRDDLRSKDPTDERILEALRQIEDRYQHQPLEKEARFTPSSNVRLHLGFEFGDYYLWRYPDALEVWSLAYRNARCSAPLAQELDGLP
jgi:bifunctional DNA-binding transcriptional regulator/antitoxin component of YhaV-PrlF toxin-antitoxin module